MALHSRPVTLKYLSCDGRCEHGYRPGSCDVYGPYDLADFPTVEAAEAEARRLLAEEFPGRDIREGSRHATYCVSVVEPAGHVVGYRW